VDLGPSITSTLVVVAPGAAVLALVIAVSALLRIDGERDVVEVRADRSGEITHLHGDIGGVCARPSCTVGNLEQSLRHVAVARYDAFGDMGGRLSSCAAIIDDRADGLVISSIHERGEPRMYAKGAVEGDSEATLTLQEQQALASARTGKGAS
jgi:hypothetical protein